MTQRIVLTLAAFVIAGFASLTAQEKEMAALEIADAKLGKDVVDRQVVDETSTFTINERVYLWMKVTGGSADSLTVTWKTGDQSYELKLNIGGSPWRTWAYKTAYTAGEWTVTVSDAEGNVLKEMNFTVGEMKE